MDPSRCVTDHQPQHPQKCHYGGSHPEHRILLSVGHDCRGSMLPSDGHSVLNICLFLLLSSSAYTVRHDTPWAGPCLWGVTLPLLRIETDAG